MAEALRKVQFQYLALTGNELAPNVPEYEFMSEKGFFHGFGHVEASDGKVMTFAIVETKTGRIHLARPNKIHFLEPPEK